MKLIVLLLGLALGFGGGVYWGVHHPVAAKKLAEEEERRVLEKQKELLAKLKTKLDQLASSRTIGPVKGVGSGFLSGAPGAAPKDPEVDQLKAESDKQMAELERIMKKQ